MSLQSTIHDALEKAKQFIGKILGSSKHLLDLALTIVNGIKNFDDKNPEVANLLAALIPGTVDDTIIAKVRQYLPELLVRLKWADNESGKTPDEIISDAAVFLKSLPADEQATAYQMLFQLLGNKLTDNGVSLPDLQKVSQVYYEASKQQ